MGIKKDGKLIDDCLDKLHEGESFFIIRAQDKTAADTVKDWLKRNPSLSVEKLSKTVDCIHRMEKWALEGKSKQAD